MSKDIEQLESNIALYERRIEAWRADADRMEMELPAMKERVRMLRLREGNDAREKAAGWHEGWDRTQGLSVCSHGIASPEFCDKCCEDEKFTRNGLT